MNNLTRWQFTLALAVAVGCGGESPPLESLPLRDALLAAPSVVASLAPEARRTAAARLDALRAAESDRDTRAAPAAADAPTAARVRAADAAREGAGLEVRVAARLVTDHGEVSLAALPLAPASGEHPTLDGPAAAADGSGPLEARALAGRGGELVAGAMRAAGAARAVRVESWPVGMVADGDTLFVNAAWLAAMAGEAADAAATPAPPSPGVGRAAQALNGNPYEQFRSHGACVSAVSRQCGGCAPTRSCQDSVLSGFAGANEECEWLNQDAARVQQLCAAMMLSSSAVRECVARTPTCAVPAPASNASSQLPVFATFVSQAACVRALDACLGGGGGSGGAAPTTASPLRPSSSSSSSSSSCSGSTYTGPSCTASSCSDSSCSSSSSSSCSGSSCSGSSCSGSSCSTGSTRCGVDPGANAGLPWRDLAATLLPLLWMARVARRRP